MFGIGPAQGGRPRWAASPAELREQVAGMVPPERVAEILRRNGVPPADLARLPDRRLSKIYGDLIDAATAA